MEHLGNISRRQLLALGAVATGSLLIPSIAYAATDEKQDSDKNSPILRTTLLTKDGELIATTENGPIAKYSENEFSFNESIHKTINSDGSITLTYSVELVQKSKARIGTFDDTPIYRIEYEPTYYVMNNNIKITSVRGMAVKKVSYASFQGSKALVAHQGIAGSAKCHAETLFTSDSKTMTTGFDAIPFVKSADSNGLVRNGGECTACLFVTGMGEMMLRAECLI